MDIFNIYSYVVYTTIGFYINIVDHARNVFIKLSIIYFKNYIYLSPIYLYLEDMNISPQSKYMCRGGHTIDLLTLDPL